MGQVTKMKKKSPKRVGDVAEYRHEGRHLTAAFEEITPDIAATYLKSNLEKQRPVKSPRIVRYTKAKKLGWILNGETIIFDSNSRLVQGQHRLIACVNAGVSFHTLVVRGVKPSAFLSMDSGAVRSLGDMLKIEGFKHYHNVAATLQTTSIYIATKRDKPSFHPDANLVPELDRRFQVNFALSRKGKDNCFELAVSQMNSRFPRAAKFLRPGFGGFLYSLFGQINPEKRDLFFHTMASGTPAIITHEIGYNCPVFLARERLIELAEDMKRIKGNLKSGRHYGDLKLFKVNIILLAWNHLVSHDGLGEVINKLNVKPNQPLPYIKNDPFRADWRDGFNQEGQA